MTAVLVRSATGSSAGTSSTVSATLAGGAITAGNTLLAVVTERGPGNLTTPTGWTYRGKATVGIADGNDPSHLYEKVAVGGESLTLTFSKLGSNGAYLVFMEFSGAGAFLSFTSANHQLIGSTTVTSPSAASTDSATLALAGFVQDHAFRYPYHPPPYLSYTATDYTIVDQASFVNGALEPGLAVAYKATGAGTQQASLTASDTTVYYGAWLAIYGTGGTPEPPPDPPEEPHEDQAPQGVLLEIYVSGAGVARWDVAHWDADLWGSAAWTDVTPEGIRIFATWGASRAEDGILAKTYADTWAIDFFDPDRLLDPGNEESPYVTDLVPGLPVRFSHRGIVIRYGVMESLGYDHALHTGYMRVTNVISYMANALVPDATSLPDTLRARARTAIAAAGLSVTVEPDPPDGDPAVAAEIDDEISVWAHITDAALQVFHIPYMDHDDVLRFRDYRAPLQRGKELAAPELVGLTNVIDGQTRYSTVRAFNGATIDSRSITPTPQYGVKVYNARDDRDTIDAEDWCQTILEDRAASGLRWVPGTVRPLTANAVEAFALIESCELVAISDAFTTPAVAVFAIVLGGDITVTAKANEEAVWAFAFRTAQSAAVPLVADQDASSFLQADQDSLLFLYPG